MPSFLADVSFSVYLILTIIVIVMAVLWVRQSDRKGLIRLGIAVALLGLVFLIDSVWESPREIAVRKMRAMADATVARDEAGIMKHVAESFRYQSLDKKGLRDLTRRAATYGEWKGATVWDFDRSEVKYVNDTTIQIACYAQPSGYPPPYWCVATFQQEADGEYRMTTFQLYNLAQKTNGPEVGLPGVR